MKKSCLPKIAALSALLVFVLVGCDAALLGGLDSGSLRLVVAGSASRGGGSRAISTSVTAVEVKMTSVPSDLFPPRMARAAYSAAGTTVTIANVKIGTWKVELFLNDASGNQLYYGSDEIAIAAGATTTASLAVFATGGVGVVVAEGVATPILAPGAPDMTAMTYPLTITFPSGVATGSTNTIKYIIGTLGAVPGDPTVGSSGGTSINSSMTSPVTMHFDDTIKARVIMADERMSAVSTFSYTRPYFSLAQGSYTGFQSLALKSMREGVTIRYTVSSAAPGADPTYEYGEIAGNNSVVTLRYPVSVLKAVSYIAGQPDTVSDIASASYTLNVAPKIVVYVNGSAATSGASTIDFGAQAPNSETDYEITLANEGNGLDLVLPFDYATLGGANAASFSISSAAQVDHSVASGEFSTMTVSFVPGSSVGAKAATLAINSNDATHPAFALNLTAVSHNAPTIEFIEGLSVKDSTYYSGLYTAAGSLNGYTGYKLSGSSNTYIFYYSGYRLGYNAGWTSLSNATSDMYDANTKYKKNTNTTSPIGFSSTLYAGTDSWGPITGNGTAPWVTWTSGINGKQLGSNSAFSSIMTVGGVLEVFYNYTADSGDTESGTTYQWYRKTSGATSWSAISGAISKTYTLTASDIVSGTTLKVDVTPKSSSGVVGITYSSTIAVP